MGHGQERKTQRNAGRSTGRHAPDGLNVMQRKFVAEYLVDGNGKAAAIRAGYSRKTAYAAASRLLKNVKVKAAMDKARKRLQAKLDVSAERVLREYALIAFANMADYMRFGQDGEPIIDLSKMARDQAAALSETGNEVTYEGGAKNKHKVRKSRIKFHSKTQALDALAKHLGLFEADNTQRGRAETPLPETVEEAKRQIDRLREHVDRLEDIGDQLEGLTPAFAE